MGWEERELTRAMISCIFSSCDLEHAPDLHQVDVFPITQTDNLAKRTQQLKRLLLNLALFGALAQIRHHAGKEMEVMRRM